MPPGNQTPFESTSNQKASVGPTVGIVVIVLLLLVGALYFWGAQLNRENATNNPPYIPGDPTSASSTL